MIRKEEEPLSLQDMIGNEYLFEVYHLEDMDDVKGIFNPISAVYVFTRLSRNRMGPYTHELIYCGETGDLSNRFDHPDHHKEPNIRSRRANCICVLCVPPEERKQVEKDILTNNHFSCNIQLNS